MRCIGFPFSPQVHPVVFVVVNMVFGKNHIGIFVSGAYSKPPVVMKLIVAHLTLIYPPTDKKSVNIVMVNVVVFDYGERGACAGVHSGISAARNFTVADGHIFGDLPADSFAVKIFHMHIIHCHFFRFKNQDSGTVAAIC